MGWFSWLDKLRPEKDAGPAQLADDGHSVSVIGAYNVRDLGGYASELELGVRTQFHRFLRSGDTASITKTGISQLVGYGVARVIDLRSDFEIRRLPDPFRHASGVTYRNIQLYSENLHDPQLMPEEPGEHANTMAYLSGGYLRMLANHEAIREIFSFVAAAKPDECVLYHCTAGMDRTGVTSMLLLGAAGVSRRDIIADYAYSYGKVAQIDKLVYDHPEFFDVDVSASLDVSALLARELAEKFEVKVPVGVIYTIAYAYDRLVGAYGSIEGYLLTAGVSPDDIAAVRARLLA